MSTPLLHCIERHALAEALADARTSGEAIAFVPTMGALHEGHLALVRRAADLAPHVVVSIFVNPTQFDQASDLAAYPRTLAADLAHLGSVAASIDARLIAYVPDVDDVYPDGPHRTLHIDGVTEHLCGASRPGHFDGVATVVDALLRAVRPTVLLMGRKDHQQLVIVRQLVAQQGHPVHVEAAPIVRDHDAVAVSSRNALLDAQARTVARSVPRGLGAGVAVARAARAAGLPLHPAEVRSAAGALLVGDGLSIDYLETVDPDRIVPVDEPYGTSTGGSAGGPGLLLAVAVHVATDGGRRSVRLIDNVLLGDVADEQRLLDALAGAADPLALGREG
jgi:pantoate--beta-alanine ligase